jgi:hypothetical protein
MSMTGGLLSVASWMDDRMNPIVVKELRQSIQSRFVVSVLILLLIILMTTLFLYIVNTEAIGQVTGNHGADLFQIFQGMLVTTCLVFVPAYVGGRLAVERASATSDLLFISTLRPSSIVWGKLLAGMVVTVLIFSACAPFMVVTYLLRGIDPPTIAFVIGLDLLVVLAATQMAILVGAVPMSMIFKVLLSLLVGVSFLWTLGLLAISMVWQMSTWGIGSRMGEWEFWAPILGFVICWLGGVGLLFFLTVAMISPPPSNKAFPLRLYMTGVWAVSLGVFIYLGSYYGGTGGWLIVWAAFASGVILTALIISVSERDVLGPRLRRSIPRNLLLRVPAFFLFSGAASGLSWSILMMALTLGVAWGYSSMGGGGTSFGSDEVRVLAAIGVAGLYLLAYALTAVLLRRWLFKHAAAVASTSAIALFLVAMGCIVPVIVAFSLNPTNWDRHGDWWLALNPLSAIFDLSSRWTDLQTRNLFIAAIWSVVMILLNFRWLSGQVGSFRPLVDDTLDNSHGAPKQAVIPPASTGVGASTDG